VGLVLRFRVLPLLASRVFTFGFVCSTTVTLSTRASRAYSQSEASGLLGKQAWFVDRIAFSLMDHHHCFTEFSFEADHYILPPVHVASLRLLQVGLGSGPQWSLSRGS
jgi:hypothetical protein